MAKREEGEEDGDEWEEGERENGLYPRLPLNLLGFPRSRAHTIGARCRFPSITVHGKALSLISGSQRGLHNCSKKPNQKANLRASKLHVTYQLGASAATELQAMHIYSSESGGDFRIV